MVYTDIFFIQLSVEGHPLFMAAQFTGFEALGDECIPRNELPFVSSVSQLESTGEELGIGFPPSWVIS